MTSALKTSTIEFCEAIRKRVVELSARTDSSETAVADAAIAALTPLRCEREARESRPRSDALIDGWMERVSETFERAASLVDKVSSQKERDYLFRLLIESTVSVIPARSELWDKTLALLDKILDSDERQTSTLALAIGMSKRLVAFPYSDEEPRRRARELADALEDNDDYERALGYALAGTRATIEQLDGEELESARQAFRDKELDGFFVDSTIEGVVRYFNETVSEFVGAVPPSRVESFLSETWTGLREALERIERGIETRVLRERVENGWEDDDLDDAEIDELRSLLKTLVVANPIAANFGEETRAFVARRDAFGAIEKLLDQVDRALETSSETDPSVRAIYFRDRAYYESERTAWLELAEKLARVDELLPQEKAARLSRLANMRFKRGEKALGRAAVLEVLKLLPRLESDGRAVPCLKELVKIHLDCGQVKPAARLASLLDEKIAGQTESIMRDYQRDDVFALYLRVFDDARLEEALKAFSSSSLRAIWRAKILVAKGELDAALAFLSEAYEQEDPVVASAALRDLAEFAVEQTRR